MLGFILSVLGVTLSLLAIVNPMAVIPIFLNLTDQMDPADKFETALVGTFAAGLIMLIAVGFGELLLALFGIDLFSLQIAGGVLVFQLGLKMAQGENTKPTLTTEGPHLKPRSIAVVPLALPVTTGPGVISAAIVYASVTNTFVDASATVVSILLVTACIYLTFRYAPSIAHRLGTDGIQVVTRLGGLVLMSLAVRIITVGLGGLLPGLAV